MGKGECQGRNDLSGATVIFELFYSMEIFSAVSDQGRETETCRHRGVWECLDTKWQIPAGAGIEGNSPSESGAASKAHDKLLSRVQTQLLPIAKRTILISSPFLPHLHLLETGWG